MPLEFAPGVNVSGHSISAEIGRGGYSRVFRAESADGGRAVAIKVAVRPELVAAFRAEGAVLRRLEGPRFVRVLEEHLDADPPWFVLELCEGGDLRALLDRSPGGRLAPDRAFALAHAVLEGVAFAHDEGVVHGDLKPENILLDGSGAPKIADLGLSRVERRRLLDHELEVVPSLATEGEAPGKVRGTFDYLAPEVRRGGEVTPSSDIYALGVLLYEMLVGQRPLGAFRMPAELLAREGVALPVALDRVVGRALAHDPLNRYRDAAQMLADLDSGEKGIELVRQEPGRGRAGANPLLVGLAQGTFEVSALRLIADRLLPAVLVPLGGAAGLALTRGEGPSAARGLAGLVVFVLSVGVAALVVGRARSRLEVWVLERDARRALEGEVPP